MKSKSNFVIGSCIACLFGLAFALVYMTLAPSSTTVAHTAEKSYSWYYKPREDGQQPIVADDASFLDDYNLIYLGDPNSKSIYLTFDSGYENGYTEKILDVLKEKNAPAAFFVTGHYMKSNPEIIKRMKDEGHLVCNHTVNHADLSATTDIATYQKELDGLCELYQEITGEQMPRFMRPPEGKYSEAMLKIVQEMGYTPVFWSFAYKDYDVDAQMGVEKAFPRVTGAAHPGAVYLLHAVSKDNTEMLGDVIDHLREQGYSLEKLA